MDVSTKQFILLLVIQLRNECEKFPQIYPGVRYLTGGGCKVTDGYKLPSKFVLHTVVGPRDQNKQKLENCCLSCLRNVLISVMVSRQWNFVALQHKVSTSTNMKLLR